MQEIKIFLKGSGICPALANPEGEEDTRALGSLIRGGQTLLRVLFRDDSGKPLAIPVCSGGYKWALADDFDHTTPPQLLVQSGITRIANSYDDETVYDELDIPITDTNTEELVEWLGTSSAAYKDGGCEVTGYDDSLPPKRIWTVQHTIRVHKTRLADGSTPTEVGEEVATLAALSSALSAHNVAANAHSARFAAKMDLVTGTAGQVIGFDADGNPVAQTPLSGGLTAAQVKKIATKQSLIFG